MASGKVEGTVAGLWRFPVKSMQGEQLEEVELTERGLLGDRAYALIDTDTGKVVSAKSVKLFPDMFGCKAMYVEPPRQGSALPSVRITLPDGTITTSISADVDSVLSAYFKRNVRLAQVSPDDFTIDQFLPDLEDANHSGQRNTFVTQKLGAALFAEMGMQSMVPEGAFFDLFPLSVLTTSTLAQFSEHQPQSNFDQRRFRMNVIVDTEQTGFVENGWIGQALGIGDAVKINVAMPDARCVMTTLAQAELPQDIDVLRTIVRHNRLQLGDIGKFPCAGVYAVIATPGTIRVGDTVALG